MNVYECIGPIVKEIFSFRRFLTCPSDIWVVLGVKMYFLASNEP